MKKLIFSTAIVLLTASGIAFAQTTTISTNPKQKGTADTASTSSSAQGERKTTDGGKHQSKETLNTASQPGRDTGGGSRVKPGGDSDGASNATSETKAKSPSAATGGTDANQEKAGAPDTRNKKNKTGKTGGKDNEPAKRNTNN